MKTGSETGSWSKVLEKSSLLRFKPVSDHWKLVLKLVNTVKYSKSSLLEMTVEHPAMCLHDFPAIFRVSREKQTFFPPIPQLSLFSPRLSRSLILLPSLLSKVRRRHGKSRFILSVSQEFSSIFPPKRGSWEREKPGSYLLSSFKRLQFRGTEKEKSHTWEKTRHFFLCLPNHQRRRKLSSLGRRVVRLWMQLFLQESEAEKKFFFCLW